MGLLDAYMLGRSVRATGLAEGTFNSISTAHAATDSFKFMSYSLTPNEDRVPRRDIRVSRQDISLMLRDRTNEFTIKSMFLPRGTNVPPDIGWAWTCGLGAETVGGSTVTYGYALTPPSGTMIVSGGEPTLCAQEKMVGMLFQETKIVLAQGQEPTVEFSGIAARSMRQLGTPTIAAGGATSATQTVGTGEAARVKVGSMVEIGANTNLRVTDRSLSGNTITLSSSITTTGGEVVRPYTPWSEASTNQGGEPIASWNGSISIGGVSSHLINGAEIVIANNWNEKRQQFSQTFVDGNPGHQMVSGKLLFDAADDDLYLLAQAEEVPQSTVGTRNPVAVVLTLGDSTNGQCVITLPMVVLNFAALQVPEDVAGTFELPFVALSQRSSGVPSSDAISVVWS